MGDQPRHAVPLGCVVEHTAVGRPHTKVGFTG